MRCLTICQPYPTLIFTPQSELPPGETQKRVENRTWETSYRGPLAIHAGKSTKWLRPGDKAKFPRMPYGAVVGVCELTDCVTTPEIWLERIGDHLHWLHDHPHAIGPVCFVLENVRRLLVPIPATGSQGFWNWQEPADLESLLEAPQ